MMHDKFNFIQNVVEACDQVREADSRSNARKRNQSERTRWLWRQHRLKLDREGIPEVGVDGSGGLCDWHGLRINAGA